MPRRGLIFPLIGQLITFNHPTLPTYQKHKPCSPSSIKRGENELKSEKGVFQAIYCRACLQIIAEASWYLTINLSYCPKCPRKDQNPEAKNAPQKNIPRPKSRGERTKLVPEVGEVECVGCLPRCKMAAAAPSMAMGRGQEVPREEARDARGRQEGRQERGHKVEQKVRYNPQQITKKKTETILKSNMAYLSSVGDAQEQKILL